MTDKKEPLNPNNDDIKQTFCTRCGGLKKMTKNGVTVPPKEWWNQGVQMASDIGCVC
jgi:hypothetical protein